MLTSHIDMPYAPPLDFVLPDYKQAGKTLRDMAHCPVWDDGPPADPVILDEKDMGFTPWDELVRLPELGAFVFLRSPSCNVYLFLRSKLVFVPGH